MYESPARPRRVVTGIVDGKSVFTSDGPVPNAHHYEAIPGMLTSVAYATTNVPLLPQPAVETAPPGVRATPGPGETRLMLVTFPPDAVMASAGFEQDAAGREQAEYLPGLAERFEVDAPGMHQTDSVDYGIVVDGEIWLELDDHVDTRLTHGDIVIQCGARHAWRNKSASPATLCFVLIGSETASRATPRNAREIPRSGIHQKKKGRRP